jgi:hypothetical protein
MNRGKFYLVDSGYPNKTGYLAPYMGPKVSFSGVPSRYHAER